jgi:hypothetical protein
MGLGAIYPECSQQLSCTRGHNSLVVVLQASYQQGKEDEAEGTKEYIFQFLPTFYSKTD